MVNNYVPAPKLPVVLPKAEELYDLNFQFPVRELETDKIRLVPLSYLQVTSHCTTTELANAPYIPAFNLRTAFFRSHPAPSQAFALPPPWHPFATVHEFEAHHERDVRSNLALCVFAMLHKSKLANEADPAQCKQQRQCGAVRIQS